MNMTPEQKSQLLEDVREIKQAIKGDKNIGLNGLVNDMKEMKDWRGSITIKMAVVSGVVSGAVVGAKAFLAKILGS